MLGQAVVINACSLRCAIYIAYEESCLARCLKVPSKRGCCLIYTGFFWANVSWRYAERMSMCSSGQLCKAAMASSKRTLVLSAMI